MGEATSNVPERYRRSSSPTPVETREDGVQRAVIVGQLVGGILHDFNNVLTVIAGAIGLLTDAVADEPQLAAMTKLIDDAAARGVARNAFSEGGKLSFETGSVRAEAGHACPRDTEGRIMIALRAHGYGNVAEHPEQIFTDIVMAEDFVRKSGGSLRRCAVSGEFARVEILLPRASATARWLAED